MGAPSLKKDIKQLLTWLNGFHTLPTYRKIKLGIDDNRPTEVDGRVYRTISKRDIGGMWGFKSRYRALRRSGYHWLELHVAGVRDKTLFITVRVPTYNLNVAPGRETINFSKPRCADGEDEPNWDFDAHYVIVD